ncbi:MAG: tetratricopeptide repeat protein [Nitrospirae bacterium]|nr:tetratricopeptide repeat protein [Nitrospirota bacterium]
MCNLYLFGLKPFVFHLVNILFHAGNSVLVFMIGSLIFREASPRSSTSLVTLPSILFSTPFIAAMLFATHPIHTAAVTWVSGLFDVSFAFFYLLSLLLYMRYKEGFKLGHVLSVVSFFASTLCKEPALTLPLILFGYDCAFRKKEDSLSTLVMRYIPYVMIVGLYMTLRINALKSLAPDAPADVTEIYYRGLTSWQYVINVLPLFMKYLNDLFLPFDLNYYYMFHPIQSLFSATGMLSAAIASAYLLAVFFAWKRNKAIFFGLLLIITPLFPAFYVKAINGNPYGQHYLYLPSLGFVVVLAVSFDLLNRKTAHHSIATLLIVLIILGLYSFQTITRNPAWKDDFTLLADAVRKSPEAELPHRKLGLVLLGMNRYNEAIEQYRIAVDLNPNDLHAHQGLAVAYTKSGMAEKATEQYQIAEMLSPAFLNEGTALIKKGLVKEAIEQFKAVLAIDPSSVLAHYNLGVIYVNSQQADKAIEHLEASVRLQPNNALSRYALGTAYSQTGAYDKAIEQFKLRFNWHLQKKSISELLITSWVGPMWQGFKRHCIPLLLWEIVKRNYYLSLLLLPLKLKKTLPIAGEEEGI